MKNRPVIIIGAGGHAKVIFEALGLSGRVVLGFVTPDLEVGTELFQMMSEHISTDKEVESAENFSSGPPVE